MRVILFCPFLIFHVTLSSSISHSILELSQNKISALETLLESCLFKNGKSPALAVSIVSKNSVLYEKAKGYTDLKLLENNNNIDEIEADKETEFPIASVTKGFTATLAVKVLSEKFPDLEESVLDMPIQKLVPSYKFILGDR